MILKLLKNKKIIKELDNSLFRNYSKKNKIYITKHQRNKRERQIIFKRIIYDYNY